MIIINIDLKARDAHDTFFISDPSLSGQGDDDLWQKVK